MVVRLTFDTPLIFRRRRPWMEARLSLVSSLGYTFTFVQLLANTPLLHRTRHTKTNSVVVVVLSCSCSTGRGGGERSIIAAIAAIAVILKSCCGR